jgi:uncharacterized protein (DUF983 family)
MSSTDDEIVPLDGDRLPDGVVDLAGFRITRGTSKRVPWERCKHRKLIYDRQDRRVRCEDCNRDLDAFDALMVMVDGFGEMMGEVRRKQAAAREATAHSVVSRAAKAVDKLWRGQRMAPCCPHCSRGLLPEDFAGGVSSAVGREYEIARRQRPTNRPAACEGGGDG